MGTMNCTGPLPNGMFSSYVQVNLYGATLKEIERRGINIPHLLGCVGFTECVMREIPLFSTELQGYIETLVSRNSSFAEESTSCEHQVKEEPIENETVLAACFDADRPGMSSSMKECSLLNCSFSTIDSACTSDSVFDECSNPVDDLAEDEVALLHSGLHPYELETELNIADSVMDCLIDVLDTVEKRILVAGESGSGSNNHGCGNNGIGMESPTYHNNFESGMAVDSPSGSVTMEVVDNPNFVQKSASDIVGSKMNATTMHCEPDKGNDNDEPLRSPSSDNSTENSSKEFIEQPPDGAHGFTDDWYAPMEGQIGDINMDGASVPYSFVEYGSPTVNSVAEKESFIMETIGEEMFYDVESGYDVIYEVEESLSCSAKDIDFESFNVANESNVVINRSGDGLSSSSKGMNKNATGEIAPSNEELTSICTSKEETVSADCELGQCRSSNENNHSFNVGQAHNMTVTDEFPYTETVIVNKYSVLSEGNDNLDDFFECEEECAPATVEDAYLIGGPVPGEMNSLILYGTEYRVEDLQLRRNVSSKAAVNWDWQYDTRLQSTNVEAADDVEESPLLINNIEPIVEQPFYYNDDVEVDAIPVYDDNPPLENCLPKSKSRKRKEDLPPPTDDEDDEFFLSDLDLDELESPIDIRNPGVPLNKPAKRRKFSCDVQRTVRCHLPNCVKKFKWKPRYGKGRFLDHVRIHQNKKTMKCRHCDFRGNLAGYILRHHKQEHPNLKWESATSCSTKDEHTELLQLWKCCFPDRCQPKKITNDCPSGRNSRARESRPLHPKEFTYRTSNRTSTNTG